MSDEGRKCHVDPVSASFDPDLLEGSATAFLPSRGISGMGCPTCEARVRNALVLADGVLDAEVDHRSGLALIMYRPETVDVEAMIRTVAAAGLGTRHEYAAVPNSTVWNA